MVAAPDFMLSNNTYDLLAGQASGEITHDGEAILRHIRHQDAGDLTFIYQKNLAVADGKLLNDGIGRPIILTRGIVLNGLVDAPDIDTEEFDAIITETVPLFEEFYKQTDRHPPFSTQARDLDIKHGLQPLKLMIQEPFGIPQNDATALNEDQDPKKKRWKTNMTKQKRRLMALATHIQKRLVQMRAYIKDLPRKIQAFGERLKSLVALALL